VALEQKRQCPAGCANIDRLPEAIKHQHMLVEDRSHIRSNLGNTTQMALACQRGPDSVLDIVNSREVGLFTELIVLPLRSGILKPIQDNSAAPGGG
jgi:hypothetical protein